jgi:hypothetical protein
LTCATDSVKIHCFGEHHHVKAEHDTQVTCQNVTCIIYIEHVAINTTIDHYRPNDTTTCSYFIHGLFVARRELERLVKSSSRFFLQVGSRLGQDLSGGLDAPVIRTGKNCLAQTALETSLKQPSTPAMGANLKRKLDSSASSEQPNKRHKPDAAGWVAEMKQKQEKQDKKSQLLMS